MVLQERIELSTSPLPRECSTTELLQRRGRELKCTQRGGQLDANERRCKTLWVESGAKFCRGHVRSHPSHQLEAQEIAKAAYFRPDSG